MPTSQPVTIETPMVADMMTRESITREDFQRNLPTGRLGWLKQIATAVLWPCSPGASFVVSHALVVDGGYTAK